VRIQHKRASFSGTEIHACRELEFVDGVAETKDNTALAASLGAKGYRVLDELPKPKPRKKGPAAEITDDVELTVQPDPEITDDVPPDAA
jgi:hypothetical protein